MTMEWMLSATVLLLAVMLIRCLLGQKLGARLRYGLWLLVLARLLLPFSIGHSAVSPANFANRTARPQTAITTAVSDSEAQLSGNAPHSEGDLSISQAPSWEAVDPSPDPVNPTTEPASPAAVQVTISWKGIWMAGMVVATLWFLFCNALFFLRLRRSRRLLGHSGRTAIYEADAPSPCLFGLLRPGIYLTPEAQADPVIRSHVLLHEKTHLRHGDPLWAFLRTICLILWWFHPLVWVAAWLSRKDCELYCDDAVIRQMGETQRIPYGRTLLMLAAQKQPVTAFCTVTTLSRSGRQLKARITAIARRVRPRVWAMILAALLALLAMGCAFAGAAESTESDAISTTQPTNQDTSREDVSDPTTDTDSDAPGDTVDPFTDAELVSPIGAMGTSLEEAQAQVSDLAFQSSTDNTQIFVRGDWTYFFRMDPTEGGYWLSGWTASGTESILDFQGAHTLTEFLDRLGVTVSDEPQLDVQLYGQEGEPLSGYLEHSENGPYFVTILTERYQMVLTFSAEGPLLYLEVSGTPEQIRPLPAVTDDQMTTGHGLSFGMTFEEALDKLGDQAQVDPRDNEGLRCITQDNIQYTFYPQDDGIYYLRDYRSIGNTGGRMPLGLELGDTLSDVLRALGSKSESLTVGTLRGTAWMPDSILVTDTSPEEIHIFTPSGHLIQMYVNSEDVIWNINCYDRTTNRDFFLAQELHRIQPDSSVYSAIVADDEDLGTVGAIMYRSSADHCNHIACGTGDPVVQITHEVIMDLESSDLGATPLTYEGEGRFSFLDGNHRTWYVIYDPIADTCILEAPE